MNNEELKNRVGSGIARLRRERGLTQAELAERINYSDKAVSKWERGESLPDVLTLMNLAQILETDLNTLTGCGAQEALPEVPEEPEITEKLPPKRRRADRSAVQKLSSVLVWVVALFLYMVLEAFEVPLATAAPMKAVARLHPRTRYPTRLKRKNQLVHFASPN